MNKEELWEEFKQKEEEMEKSRDDLARRGIKNKEIQKEYESHFGETKRLFSEIRDLLAASVSNEKLANLESTMLYEQRAILHRLSEEREDLKQQEQQLMRKQDDLYYEYRKKEQVLEEEVSK